MSPDISFPVEVVSASFAITRYYDDNKKRVHTMRFDRAAKLLYELSNENAKT